MEELPTGGFGLEHEKFSPALTPPLFDEDSPEDKGSSASAVAPNKSQDSSSSSTYDPDAYIELNDLLDPTPPEDTADNYNSINDDSDDYFDPEELLKLLLGSKSDGT